MIRKLRLRVSGVLRRRLLGILWNLISENFSRFNLLTLMDLVLASYYERTSQFITWDVTPLGQKVNKYLGPRSTLNLEKKIFPQKSDFFPNPFGSDLTIVIQGQVISKNNLTQKIVEYYLTNFNEVKVLLSTWNNTSNEDLHVFDVFKENPRFQLLLNTPPRFPGVFNINNQIVSTYQGLAVASKESKYVIKTRTDQLLASPLLLRNLHILWESHGKTKKTPGRIVVSSMNTFGFRYFSASDMFQFGISQDLLNYWTQPLDERPITQLSELSKTMRLEGRKLVAEVYLNANYFKKLNGNLPNFAWGENLEFMRDAFVVADQHSLGQIWAKNTHLADRWNFGIFPHKYYEFTHLDWLSLSLDMDHWIKQEHLTDSKEFYAFE